MTTYPKPLRAIPWSCGALLAFCALGCSATGMVQTAQTLGKGGWEVSIDPGLNGAFGQDYPAPVIHGAVRYGVADRFDIGARIGTTLAEVQAKILFTPPESSTIAVSIAPAAGIKCEADSLGCAQMLNLTMPVLIGFKFGPHELTLGPRAQYNHFSGGNSAHSAAMLSAGMSLGFAAQIDEKHRLLPEFSLATPVLIEEFGLTPGTSDWAFEVGQFFFSLNLGIQVGSPRKNFATSATQQK